MGRFKDMLALFLLLLGGCTKCGYPADEFVKQETWKGWEKRGELILPVTHPPVKVEDKSHPF